jgi:hypothetical protein
MAAAKGTEQFFKMIAGNPLFCRDHDYGRKVYSPR